MDLVSILNKIQIVLNTTMPLLIGIAVVWFMWGVISYVISGDDEKKNEARTHVIQGLIGLFVILSFWGIVGIINNTLGVDRTQLKVSDIPCIPVPPSSSC